MRKVLAILFAFCVMAAFAVASQGATVMVKMTRFSTYDPKDITVDRGDTVLWTNTFSLPHDSVSFENVWKSPLLGNRGTYSFVFDLPPGRYDYYCTPHLSIGMVGSVTVRAPANAPPTATITSPGSGATFVSTETIPVSVDARDDSGTVAKVELLVDGAVVATKTAGPFDFSITLEAGAHLLTARATDGPGLTGVSPAINITVTGPNLPPTVTLVSPTGGSFTAPATIFIEASATDDVEVDRVEFFVNGASIGSDATAPYSISQTFAAGTYRLSAKAFDAAGLEATSAEVSITVTDPIPETPTVTILAPAQDEFVNTNAVLVAEAIDLDGVISSVEFVLGTNSLGVVTTSAGANRFELSKTLGEGRQSLTVIATDDDGHVAVSPPVSFTVLIPPELTTITVLTNEVVRLSAFGTSGIPLVFDYSDDGGKTWIPFLTNVLYRRILFLDDTNAVGHPSRMYRAPRPL